MKNVRKLFVALCLACAFCALLPAAAFAIQPGTDDTARQLYNDQFHPGNGEDGADVEWSSYVTTCTTASFTYKVVNPTTVNAGFEYMAYVHPVTGAIVKVTPYDKNDSFSQCGYSAWNYKVKVTGLVPGTTYQLPVFSVYMIDGVEVASAAQTFNGIQTQAMAKVTPAVTKITSGKARATVTLPAKMRTAGAFSIKLFAGTTCIKTWNSTAAGKYAFAYTKAGAAKKSYKVKVIFKKKTSLATTSTAVKAKANVKTWTRSKNPTDYGYSNGKCVATRLSYNSKGKLVAKVLWVNTLLSRASSHLKVRVTVKCQGKKIASQVFTSKAITRMNIKAGTLTFKKAKKGYDLRNGNTTWSFALLKAY